MFNTSYETASLVFLAIIVWRFFSQRQFPLHSNKVFGVIILMAMGDIAADILSTVTMVPGTPAGIPYLFNTLYYLLQIAFPAALAVYILELAGNSRTIPGRLNTICCIPAILAEFIIIIGLPMGKVFTISEAMEYTRGPLAYLTYINFAFYMMLSVVFLIVYRKDLARAIAISFAALEIIVAACVALQFIHKNILLTGLGIAAALVLMYFNIEDPRKMTDTTTDAFNHSAFRLYLQAARQNGYNINILALHIEGLRKINTIYGTKDGDMLLKHYSDYLAEDRRVWVFRLSGTRFVLLTHSDALLNKAIKAINSYEPPLIHGNSVKFDVTGCILRNAGTIEPNIVLSIIESNLIDNVPGQEGSTLTEIDYNFIAKVERMTIIESVLKDSILTGEGFTMHYQPVYSLDRKRFVSAESLLRFYNPRLKNVRPDEFIPIAEETGIAPMLDELVVRLVFKEVASGTFKDSGLNYVQINLSVASFANDRITQYIISLLSEYDVDPSFIVFEITETATNCESGIIKDNMDTLCTHGFRFAMDDFGTGYSSITRQISLPFSIVKLDKSLLYSSRDIFRELVSLIQKMPVKLVAEGVETQEQSDFVGSLGVDMIQGYLYAKPMPPDELKVFLKK